MDIGAIIFGVFAITVTGYMLYVHNRNAKKEAEQQAKIDALWLADYHNPSSPNYDKARVDAEWAQDPTNPDSPNYDPDA